MDVFDEETCPWCGEPLVLGLADVWPEDRSFLIDSCCERAYDEALLSFTSEDWRALFWRSAGLRIRSLFDGLDSLRIDFGLHLVDVDFSTCVGFVDRHHRHHRPPVGWRWGHGVANGCDLVGVAMVGRPVSHAFDPCVVVEVTRLCIDHDFDQEITRDAASMLLGAAAREARRRDFAHIITYTLVSEPGTSLKAAGWTPEHLTRGGSWHRASRPRRDSAPTCRKVRWGRGLAH
jgi:hypothetical protein